VVFVEQRSIETHRAADRHLLVQTSIAVNVLFDGPLRFRSIETRDGSRYQFPERRPFARFGQLIASPRGFETLGSGGLGEIRLAALA
jgi:hypothetical protein